MVKNSKGGKHSKAKAHKHEAIKKERALVIKESPLEHYGCITKVYGGRLCDVINNDMQEYKLHVRGKFRCNMVKVGTIVLFGERDFASDKTNVDLLYVYEDREIGSLSGINKLMEMRSTELGGKLGQGDGKEELGGIMFSMEASFAAVNLNGTTTTSAKNQPDTEDAPIIEISEEVWDSI